MISTRTRNSLKTGAKAAFSLGALVFIFTALDKGQLGSHLSSISLPLLLLAAAINAASQGINALRFHYYCRCVSVPITRAAASRLYFIGVFLNHLLPGGIGGDGYIALILKRRYHLSIKKAIRLLLSTRANGLLVLVLGFAAFGVFSEFSRQNSPTPLFLGLVALATLLSYGLAARHLLKETYQTQIGAAVYSLGILGLIIVFYILLLRDMHVPENLLWDYIALLLLSNVLILIPISLGGLGLRELGFFYASYYVGLDAELGIVITLLHYSFNLVLSPVGAWFLVKNPPVNPSADPLIHP